MSNGSNQRPTDKEQFDKNYDQIFGKKDRKGNDCRGLHQEGQGPDGVIYRTRPTIEEKTQVSVLRFFKKDSESMADYDAIVTVTWMTDTTVFMSGFKGTMTKRNLRDLYKWLSKKKITRVMAQRSPLHRLPFSTEIADGLFSIDIGRLLGRLEKSDEQGK
jgi:hypothetical protein